MKTDLEYMDIALDAARKGAVLGEVPVGAIIVDESGEVLAIEHNAPVAGHDPTAHAEIRAIRSAAKEIGNYRLSNVTLYVTLEPCAMCAGAISHARIGSVVFGAEDEKGGAVLHGPKFFSQPTCHHRPSVRSGIRARESAELLRGFFKARRK